MIRHDTIARACRSHLASLQVCTTGTATLSATATGYARTTGSFLTDGFAIGMQITPTGFTESLPAVVTAVTALTITTDRPRAVDAPAGGRSLAVLAPDVAYSNVRYVPTVGRPWILEEYLPGGGTKIVLGALGTLEALPLYVLRLHCRPDTDASALWRYADAITRHFAPTTTIPEPAQVIRVRADFIPSLSPLAVFDGWASVSVTIPLRVHAPNAT